MQNLRDELQETGRLESNESITTLSSYRGNRFEQLIDTALERLLDNEIVEIAIEEKLEEKMKNAENEINKLEREITNQKKEIEDLKQCLEMNSIERRGVEKQHDELKTKLNRAFLSHRGYTHRNDMTREEICNLKHHIESLLCTSNFIEESFGFFIDESKGRMESSERTIQNINKIISNFRDE
mmetsp:Transcript_24347/g.51700  ORF Transcript_24347/g.51700 Transcript_24347/m.51700 type:complete len:183 (-) Transcript_24347:38-586(-)